MRLLRLGSFFLLGGLASCDEASFFPKPEAAFGSANQYRAVNLTWVLGAEFRLLSATDTIALHLTFDPATGANTLVSPTADTVLTARLPFSAAVLSG